MAGNSMASLDLEDLSQKLATGFEILLDQVKDLAQKEARLRKNLEEAKKNVSLSFRRISGVFYDEKPKLALERKLWLLSNCFRERALHVLPDRILWSCSLSWWCD